MPKGKPPHDRTRAKTREMIKKKGWNKETEKRTKRNAKQRTAAEIDREDYKSGRWKSRRETDKLLKELKEQRKNRRTTGQKAKDTADFLDDYIKKQKGKPKPKGTRDRKGFRRDRS